MLCSESIFGFAGENGLPGHPGKAGPMGPKGNNPEDNQGVLSLSMKTWELKKEMEDSALPQASVSLPCQHQGSPAPTPTDFQLPS